MIVNRVISNSIRKIISKYPIIAVTGPRQSGKTTLLKSMFPDYEYVSLENPDMRSFAETDPNGFLKKYNEKIIFDEIQRVPSLFSYLQTIVDESGMMGQFFLSGSQNFHLMNSITQSLAGRVAIFKLFPFDFQELKSVDWLQENYAEVMIKGFYPAIYDRDIEPNIFYSNYLQTYIQRDVSELIAIKDMHSFNRFIALCATRAGQLLNLNALANECGISQPTAKAWLSALESSYIVFLLNPFHKNFSKRIIKSPKLYFYDTGLLAYLLKINDSNDLLNQSVKGALFENMMVSEYIKRIYHKNVLQSEVWFWRDTNGNEVDLLIQKSKSLEVVEIKATETIMPDLFKGLNYFENLAEYDNLSKILVYGGSEYQQRSVGSVIPWFDFGK
ncbi:MAG: ATP-binding protein [Parabacteroides sp.]|nr:ATP-binding protein [Parabacteroides sp.]